MPGFSSIDIAARNQSLARYAASRNGLSAIEPAPAPDFIINDQGSIVLFLPNSPEAREWIAENIPDDAMWFGRSLAVEHRFADDIIAGIEGDGLAVQ